MLILLSQRQYWGMAALECEFRGPARPVKLSPYDWLNFIQIVVISNGSVMGLVVDHRAPGVAAP